MKKSDIFCLFIAALTIPILLSGIGRVYAGDRGGARSIASDSTKFDLLWEKEFPKEIKDVAWGETKDGRLYPKIVVFEDEVRFYDEKANLLASQTYQKYARIRISPKGDYIGIPTRIRPPAKEQRGLQTFAVYSVHREGAKVWERKEKMEYDYPLYGWCISNKNGSAVRLDHPSGKLLFIDSQGGGIREVDLFQDDEWDIERHIADYAFSESGKYFIVNANEGVSVPIEGYAEGHPGVSANPHLILFTGEGKEIWRQSLSVFNAGNVAVSSDGEYIIATGYTSHAQKGTIDAFTWLVKKDGSIIKEYSFLARHIKFSPNEKYITLDYHKPALTPTIPLIESKSGEILWQYKIEASPGKVSNLIVSNEGEVQATFAMQNVRIFDHSGEIIYQRGFPEKNLVTGGLSTNGKWIGISTTQKVAIMEMRKEGK